MYLFITLLKKFYLIYGGRKEKFSENHMFDILIFSEILFFSFSFFYSLVYLVLEGHQRGNKCKNQS